MLPIGGQKGAEICAGRVPASSSLARCILRRGRIKLMRHGKKSSMGLDTIVDALEKCTRAQQGSDPITRIEGPLKVYRSQTM